MEQAVSCASQIADATIEDGLQPAEFHP